ncbi:hypothetical protein [Leptospira kanakyensis]|uniref:hypothetical protein n=1 Tax=Leptospira kanakyensis TaxID=2484968 RepID=UPI00223DED65|nr:hypothetical protein [Leptospira kanakyensis]MCW7483161.1 hypothetical protein [Leptospira kanakyensis]
MEIRNKIIYLSFFVLSCNGNFFPNDEETGEAAKQRCAESIYFYFDLAGKGRTCDICLLSISIDCKPKKSGQLIKF